MATYTRSKGLQGAEKYLKKLTPAGRAYVITSVDPFHDETVEGIGYPDITSALSVTNIHRASVDIDAPASAAGNWDCAVFISPFLRNSQIGGGAAVITADTLSFESTPPQAANLYSVSVWAADAGQGLFPYGAIAGWTPTNFEARGVNSLPANTEGPCRWIATGVEVHNTTAEIYKQGSVVCGANAGLQTIDHLQVIDDDAAHATFDQLEFQRQIGPPSFVTDAQVIPNAVSWAAKDGVYMVAHPASTFNPINQLAYRGLSLSAKGGLFNYGWASAPTWNATTGKWTNAGGWYPANHGCSWAMFCGLSNETTLRVTARFYYEVFPNSDSGLLSQARPSPPMDAKAIELASILHHSLPPATQVGMNPGGEWWKIVSQQIVRAAPAVGLALEPIIPGAAMVGAAIPRVAQQAAVAARVAREGRKVLRQMKAQQQKKRRSQARKATVPKQVVVKYPSSQSV